MNYYVIRVQPRQEEKFIQLTKDIFSGRQEELIFLRKKLQIQQGGKKFEVETPLFPGYLFFQTQELDPDLYWSLKSLGGLHRFLRAEGGITPLGEKDRDLLGHFLRFGEVAGKSLVSFDPDNRIQVIKGPMMGLEGNIVSVDRRKQRAKISLSFQDKTFSVDLGYEALVLAPGPRENSSDK